MQNLAQVQIRGVEQFDHAPWYTKNTKG
jgi:hypothetical protein